MMKNLSPKIYKYQPFNIYSLDNLVNNQIWLSNPMDLNDPFEGKMPFQLIEPNEQEWSIIHNKFINGEYPGWKKRDENVENKYPNEEQKQLYKIIARSNLGNLIFKKRKVACFSTEKNLFLMWSHYADGQRGFCLEFDKTMPPFLFAESIDYIKENDYKSFEIDAALTRNIELANDAYRAKVHWWEYEREVRYITSNDKEEEKEEEKEEVEEKKAIHYDPKALTAIYCGSEMLWGRIRLLYSIIKYNNWPTIIFGRDHRNGKDGFSLGPIEKSDPDAFGYTANDNIRYS